MKKRQYGSLPALGGSSLLVIFAVLCLTVLALLSLITVLAEQRLSQAHARSVEEWYGADLQAQEIFARLRSGETVPGVERREDTCQYSVPVSGHQTLQVTLRKKGNRWEILSWQTVAHPEAGDSSLPVYDGGNL